MISITKGSLAFKEYVFQKQWSLQSNYRLPFLHLYIFTKQTLIPMTIKTPKMEVQITTTTLISLSEMTIWLQFKYIQYSDEKILTGILQGFVLGPLFIIMHSNDIKLLVIIY